MSDRRKLLVWLGVLLLAAVFVIVGCVSTEPVYRNHAQRLMGHPDFQKAGQAAPEWVLDALQTIETLERERDERRPN